MINHPLQASHRENSLLSSPALRLAELVSTLALAQDNAFGQPLESQLRSCLLAMWLCEEAGYARELCDAAYWVALLRYIGCTGHAHEVATIFGDEIAFRAQMLVQNAADPDEVMRDALSFATAGCAPEQREQIVLKMQHSTHEWAVHNFESGCEVGDMLVERLGFGADVRDALRYTFERWNGNGYPNGARGDEIPLAMRIVHLTHDMEAIARLLSPADALRAVRERRDRTYDPEIADVFAAKGAEWFDRLDRADPWNGVLALEPAPRRVLTGDDLDDALLVAADFIDLKSPYMGGHSRRCAELGVAAGLRLGFPDDDLKTLWRAALVHEFGTTALPNSILDKPAALTRAEFDRVELHPYITEQMLRRSPALAPLNPIACAHHEKADGSGYHKRLHGAAVDPGAPVLAATDIYVGLTTERADRRAFSPEDAASELRQLAADGALEPHATHAVLAAAGHGEAVLESDSIRAGLAAEGQDGAEVVLESDSTHAGLAAEGQDEPAVPASATEAGLAMAAHGEPAPPSPQRSSAPGGLTPPDVDVLCLAAKGLTTQQIADRLSIAPEIAGQQIEQVYGKIGVATRAAAALWAMQNRLAY